MFAAVAVLNVRGTGSKQQSVIFIFFIVNTRSASVLEAASHLYLVVKSS